MLPDQETINHKPYKNLNKKPSTTDMVYCISKTQYAPCPSFCFKIPYLGEPYSRSTSHAAHRVHDNEQRRTNWRNNCRRLPMLLPPSTNLLALIPSPPHPWTIKHAQLLNFKRSNTGCPCWISTNHTLENHTHHNVREHDGGDGIAVDVVASITAIKYKLICNRYRRCD